MKLIHCSDIHLDSPMEANLSPARARERNAEICRTFSRMVDYAKAEGVSAVLLAGDLFDSQRISVTTGRFILDTIAEAGDITFYYIKGNHDEADRAFAGRSLPANLVTFTDTWTSHDLGEVTLTALELTDDNALLLYDTLQLDPDRINLVMLHGQISHQAGPELICLPALRGKHIDALVLGHIHSYQTGKLDDRGIWCYCGCTEGRGYDECGPKGFVLWETKGRELTHSFVPFAARTLHEVPVDMTGLKEAPEILTAMTNAAREIPEKDLVKFTLTGNYTTDTHKDTVFLKTMLESRFYGLKIKDESRLAIDAADYAQDISLKGEFVRLVMAADLPEEDRDRIIMAGLAALRGEEIGL